MLIVIVVAMFLKPLLILEMLSLSYFTLTLKIAIVLILSNLENIDPVYHAVY